VVTTDFDEDGSDCDAELRCPAKGCCDDDAVGEADMFGSMLSKSVGPDWSEEEFWPGA